MDVPELSAESAEGRNVARNRSQLFELNDLPRVDLNDVLERFDPISVGTEYGREYIVVAPRGERSLAIQEHALPQEKGKQRIGIGADSGTVRRHDVVDYVTGTGVAGQSDLGELGTAVASPWTSWTRREYNADLYGYKGLRIYDKMRKSDGTVRGTLRLAKTPVLSAQWIIKPASENIRDQNISDFVWANLTSWMSMSFPQFVAEALLMLEFGYYMFEKVFARGEDVTNDPRAKGKIVWKKLAPRHPLDVKEWFFDLNGGPLSVDMYAPPVQLADASVDAGANTVPKTFEGGVIQAFQRYINIPIDKLLVFSFDKEAGNIEGISLLRSCYKHWFYKDNLYKIDAIQKERHGIGIPIIQLPVGYSQQDKNAADQLGRNLRTNERAHVVLPPQWILEFAELKGHPVDCLPSIRHHDDMIPQTILGQFINKQQTGAGSEEQHTIFLKAVRVLADIFTDILNKYAIPQLVNMNWGRAVYPKLIAKRIGEQEDWRTQSFTLRNLVGAGIIVPDDPMENQLRDEMGLPPVDTASARVVRGPALENPQRVQPAPTELPGAGHQTVPANIPGQPGTPNQPPPAQPSQPEQIKGPIGLPAQQTTGRGAGLQQKQNAAIPNVPAPTPPRVGLPRQTKPGVVKPSTGKGDGSGSSKRRGQ